jgi:hypothetical protein
MILGEQETSFEALATTSSRIPRHMELTDGWTVCEAASDQPHAIGQRHDCAAGRLPNSLAPNERAAYLFECYFSLSELPLCNATLTFDWLDTVADIRLVPAMPLCLRGC